MMIASPQAIFKLFSRPSIISNSLRRKPLSGHRTPNQAALHVSPPITSLAFSIEQGLPPFLSSNSLTSLAVDWQNGLLDRLNQHVKGTSAENKSLFDTIIDLAKDRTQVIPFNLASEALNNSFFLNGLKTADTHLPNRPSENSLLAAAIDETYGSMTQFISYFSNAAMGMSSSGYIWLVCDQDGSLGICATYGAGTILVQNREQRGDWTRVIRSQQIGLDSFGRPISNHQRSESGQIKQEDSSVRETFQSDPQGWPHSSSSNSTTRMFSTSCSPHEIKHHNTNIGSSEKLGKSAEESQTKPKTVVSFADSLFASPTPSPHPRHPAMVMPNRAITRKNTNPSERFNHLHPLMNLVVSERAYLIDYGVWGKESYLKNFWKCVDWLKIEQAFLKFAPKPSSHQSYSSIWKT